LDLVHDPSYETSILDGSLDSMAARRLGFPWSPELRERSLRTVQGTLEAAHDALAQGAGMNLAGGTHHAFADHGEGFCVFNDVA
jgi:acetoin utilization deacetylase AcuC-like enzyme